MNIVRILEKAIGQMCESRSCCMCWSFTYARKDYANLYKKPETEQCCVHVYLTKFKKRTRRDENGIVSETQWTFEMNILLDSLFDIQMFNELEPDDAKSKFTDYVEPILECFGKELYKRICAMGYSLSSEEVEADYNRFDQNKDGIFYRATLVDQN